MTQTQPEHQSTESLRNSANPESLDKVVATTTPRLWWALVAMIGLIALIVVWAFVGRIPVSVTVTGVFEIADGRQVIPGSVEGSVTLFVLDQEVVVEGQQLATITPFDTSLSAVVINAPFAGTVTSVSVRNGAGVSVGAEIMVVTPTTPRSSGRVIAYADPVQISTFIVGNEVTVQIAPPVSSNAAEISGTITAVGEVPVSIADLVANYLPNSEAILIGQAAGGLVYPVIISLADDSNIPSIEDGVLVTVVNTYENLRPIDAITGGSR